MKNQIRKWILRLSATGLLCLGFLLGIILNPTLLYANKTTIGNYTIYHNAPLDENLLSELNIATEFIKTSELYSSNLKLDVCLNDGSIYPAIMEKLRGQAFGWGFYDKVVLMGKANYKDNFVELNGYKWNLTQLIAHEETHCFQFHKFGLWKSNPVANHPNWKWEGYPEYVSRRNTAQLDLKTNIARKIAQENLNKDGWAISFSDSTIAPRAYYNAWLLLQYCLDIKKMTYENLLKDTTDEQTVTTQMMNWFESQKVE
jgi:hypothetical protein